MANETKSYLTTERAGFVVAGRRVPGEWRDQTDKDGKPVRDEKGVVQVFLPKVGFTLELLDKEAEYELAQETIALAPAATVPEPAEAKSRSKSA